MLVMLGGVTTALEVTAAAHSLPYDEVQQLQALRKLADVLENYAFK